MTKDYYKMVDDAIEEAKRNLTGEDLQKCIEALHNWIKNNTYLISLNSKVITHDQKMEMQRGEVEDEWNN